MPQPGTNPKRGSDPEHGSAEAGDRRSFLTATAAVATGGVISVAPLAIGAYTFADPLGKQVAADGAVPLVRVAALDSLPADGVPRPFPVVADRRDAWNVFPQEVIGTVYLRRLPGNADVQAFHATCPHLGCFVEYNAQRQEYQCPCHTSKFDIAGDRILPCVSPRNLDTLDCQTREGQILVGFQNFHTGLDEKKPKA